MLQKEVKKKNNGLVIYARSYFDGLSRHHWKRLRLALFPHHRFFSPPSSYSSWSASLTNYLQQFWMCFFFSSCTSLLPFPLPPFLFKDSGEKKSEELLFLHLRRPINVIFSPQLISWRFTQMSNFSCICNWSVLKYFPLNFLTHKIISALYRWRPWHAGKTSSYSIYQKPLKQSKSTCLLGILFRTIILQSDWFYIINYVINHKMSDLQDILNQLYLANDL